MQGKLKLISAEDADLIRREADAYRKQGYSPDHAERFAVVRAINENKAAGEDILNQIRQTRPEAHAPASDFWNRQVVRRQMEAPRPIIAPAVSREVPAPVAAPPEAPRVAPPAPEVPAVARPPVEAPAAVAPEPVAEKPAAIAPEPVVTPVAEAPRGPEIAEVPERPAAAPPEEAPAPKALTPEQQVLVDSLPEHQKAKGAAAMAEDTSPDPYRAREGDPTPEENRAKSVSPHENQATADAAKYGLFDDDSTSDSVLRRVAADKTQPRWLRVIADLLIKSGAHEGLSFNVTNRPESSWAGLYYGSKSRQDGTAHINLAVKSDSLAKTIIHEVTHHIMLSRLSVDPARLTPIQLQARQSLEKLFDQLKNHRDLRGEYGVRNGDLHEFISEMFSNDKFRKKLNSIYPEGSRQSVGQMIRRLLAKVGFGDEGIKAGGYLDEAMRHALNVADVRSGIQESAMRELRATPEEMSALALGRRRDETGFFSGLARVVAAKLQKVSSAEQAKNIIKQVANQEEIKWSNVNGLIDKLAAENKGRVNRDQLENLLETNSQELKEHTLGGDAALKEYRASQDRIDKGIQDLNYRIGEATNGEVTVRELVSGYKSPDDLNPAAKKLWDERSNLVKERETLDDEFVKNVRDTKYASYQVPGGENYREKVLAMPRGETTNEEARKHIGLDKNSWDELTNYERQSYRQQAYRNTVRAEYTSSHFADIPNYVAHSRMNDRVDAQGRPGLFLEEIQSDRHQKAREQGYKETDPVELKKRQQEIYARQNQITDRLKEIAGVEGKSEEFDRLRQENQTLRDENNELNKQIVANVQGVPDAPFRKDWHVQMFKRALRDAIADGKQWIGWTTGETQAERYDLSKQVKGIEYVKNPDGTYFLSADLLNGDSHIFERNAPEEKIADYVGKEVAEKIVGGEGSPMRDDPTHRQLSGLDLKVGGEGMKGFYDKILPNEVGKYVKQWGGKVEQADLTKPKAERWVAQEDYRGHWIVADTESPTFSGAFGSRELAQEHADSLNKTAAPAVKMWKVEITPQMKEQIGVEGQPMYGAKALPDPQTSPRPLAVEPVQDGRDMSAHPMMRGVGYLERFITDPLGAIFTRRIVEPGGLLGKARPERAAGYEEAGPFAPSAKWDRYAWSLVQKTRQSGAEAIKRAQYLKGDVDREAGKAYGGPPNEAQLKSLNTALGNIDNRITEAQEAQANTIRDRATKDAYLSWAKAQNLQAFRAEQSRELAALPTTELRNAVVAMRDAMDELSTSIFFHGRDGGITPGARAAIQENIGTYMHRAYDIFHDNKAHLKWLKSQDPKAQQVVANAMVVFDRYARAEVAKDYAIAQAAAGTPVTAFQALNHALGQNVDLAKKNLLDQYLRVAEEGPGEYSKSLLGGQVPGKVGQALITERGVIPEEIQALWGRREDPGTNFAHTYTSLAAMTAKLQQQKSLLDDGIARGYIWKKDVSPGRDHPEGFLELVPSGKSMGVLDNTWVAPEFHAAMSEMTHPQYNSWFDNALSKFNGYLLSAKTIGSQASAIHNFGGNGAVSFANGNIIMPMLMTGDVAGHVKGGYEAVKQQLHDSLGLWKDDAQMRAASLRGVELGVTREGLDYNWLNKLWGKPKEGSWKSYKGKSDLDELHDFGKYLVGKYGGFTREFYSAMDDVWKSYNWKQEQLKYKWAYKDELANGTMTMPQIEEMTARIVRRNTPTYSEAFDVYQRIFGKSTLGKIFGPYTMFYAEMIRNVPAIWRQGVEEVRSPNNKVKAIGASRLTSLSLALTVLPTAVASLFKWKNGYDDKDEEALRSAMPDWQKSNLIAMRERDKDGNPTYMDLGYMNPYGLITNPVYDGFQAAKHGNPDDYFPNFAASAAWSFAKPFMKQQFVYQLANDLRYNQDSSSISGARIWNPQDSFENKSKAVIYRLYKAARPGFMDTLERIQQAREGRVSPGGKKYELGTEIPAAFGLRTTKYDLEQGLGQLTSSFGNNLRDADNVFNSKFNTKGTVDPGVIEAAYKQADESRFLLFRKMRADYLGHVHMGLSPGQALTRMKMGYGDIIRKTGMKQSELMDILTNIYRPYTPSDTAIKAAIYAHPERYQEYMKAFTSARPRELDY
jgi:hypothetical protein